MKKIRWKLEDVGSFSVCLLVKSFYNSFMLFEGVFQSSGCETKCLKKVYMLA